CQSCRLDRQCTSREDRWEKPAGSRPPTCCDLSMGLIGGYLDRSPAMSRSPEDPASRLPRRPRPAPDPSTGRGGMGSEHSTFRPNPVGSTGAGKLRGPQTGGTRARGDATYEVPAAGPKWWERILFGRVSSGQL